MSNHLFSNPEEKERQFSETLKSLKELRLGNRYLSDIRRGDRIFVSQNWYNYPENKPRLFELQKRTSFLTIPGFYFDLAPCPILGVTGTKGKTTTVNLILHILRHSGRTFFFAGNNRYIPQSLTDLNGMAPNDLLVMEISNRHLMSWHHSPHVGVVTNVLEDHLIEHGGFQNYVRIKKRFLEFQKPSDVAVLNHSNLVNLRLLDRFRRNLASNLLYFALGEKKLKNLAFFRSGTLVVRWKGKETEICRRDSIRIPGDHNGENVLAAAAAAFAAGVSPEAIARGIGEFTGVSERIERVREVSGVTFYNDLSSTTPDSTLAALKTLGSDILWITGADHKGSNFGPLLREIRKRVKRMYLLPGTVEEKLKPLLQSTGRGPGFTSKVDRCVSLPEAVQKAYRIAKPGDRILLSPGAAYFHTKFIKGRPSFDSLVKRLKPK
jgi:UDP-N-acetylmuramoylalanine--D-glutamate ligase